MLGLYRATLLHTSISSDSLSSFPLPPVFLSPARSILFPSFPSDIRGLPPLPPLSNLLSSASSTFSSSSTSFYSFATLPLPPSPSFPAQPLAHPSPRLTYLTPPPPFPPVSSHPDPFLNPDTLPPSFSSPPSRAPSHLLPLAPHRPLPRNVPTDKQTADTLQFYAIVGFLHLFVHSNVDIRGILLRARDDEDAATENSRRDNKHVIDHESE